MLKLIPNLINAVLFGGAVTNEATGGLITEITKVDSLELLAAIAVIAGGKFVVTWIKNRFNKTATPPNQ